MKRAEIEPIIEKLLAHLKKDDFKGYDPYDALLFPLPWQKMGKWVPIYFIQFLKHLPVNIRPLLGIKKNHNPKAMGLLLHTFSNLFKKTGKEKYKTQADELFNWLVENYSKGQSGMCWGYNFPWASKLKFLPAYSPTTVVTGFVCKGIFAYYQATKNEKAKDCLISAADFVLKDIPVYYDKSGLCYSYSLIEKDICYNASLLAAEVLAFANYFLKDPKISEKIKLATHFVISRQKNDGSWYYSQDPSTFKERKQIDFHQGYIIDSLNTIQQLNESDPIILKNAIIKGMHFYHRFQFFETGQAKYRLPLESPTDIHNLAQGIITFSRVSLPYDKLADFPYQIANWSIQHMYSKKGYFKYRKGKLLVNNIDYARWSQSWMALALSEIL